MDGRGSNLLSDGGWSDNGEEIRGEMISGGDGLEPEEFHTNIQLINCRHTGSKRKGKGKGDEGAELSAAPESIFCVSIKRFPRRRRRRL